MLMNSFQFGIICDDLVMNSVLETKSQVMHFPPNGFIQKILRQFSRARLRNKNWNIICNHVSFWVRSNFFWQGSQGISNSDRQKNTITTLHILYCICALHVHHVTVKKKIPPFPEVHNDACVQVTFWQAGHKGMYDILIAVYELSPGNQVSSSIYAFAILCFLIFFVTILFKGYCMLLYAYVHYICTSKYVSANIGSDWNMFATCMLHVLSCKTFPTGHKGVGWGRDT